MGPGSSNDEIYDLRRIEDVFACLEIISFARGALFAVDPALAKKMEKVSDALSFFSELVAEGELVPATSQAPPAGQQPQASAPQNPPVAQPSQEPVPPAAGKEESEGGIADLLSDVQGGAGKKDVKSAPALDEEDEAIVDILTGERIK